MKKYLPEILALGAAVLMAVFLWLSYPALPQAADQNVCVPLDTVYVCPD
ncbi:hypothetical protein J2X19_001265 [Rhodoferax ferrireducens]|uniref:Secreted protein n=1 Tax=Rhodoferax ferrireducens TaxID=192843 RepID=A0ABU2C5Q7_9BURK|nr:hypothetical protein [Rhodoferax ferrireducens]MDR7376607.1 hypothetical protein [Rhodoferax ferrireducens]